jgi:hypothetical protein
MFQTPKTMFRPPETMGKRFSHCAGRQEHWENRFPIVPDDFFNVPERRNNAKTAFPMCWDVFKGPGRLFIAASPYSEGEEGSNS